MLAKIAPRFVISRVIQNSYLAENQAIQLLKLPFNTHQEHFNLIDPQDYQVVRFFGYISSLSKPQFFTDKYEKKAYDLACERFKIFNQTLEVYEKMNQFFLQVRTLYNYVQRNNSSSNLFSQSLETNQEFEQDVLESIDRYRKLQNNLAAYPEWQAKVKQQIGGLYHLIHNNLAESQSKRNIFSKLDRQEYFL